LRTQAGIACSVVCLWNSVEPSTCSKISGTLQVLKTWTKHHEMTWLVILAM
jgi:hypothetical protein